MLALIAAAIDLLGLLQPERRASQITWGAQLAPRG
jgi:hypothetical protein